MTLASALANAIGAPVDERSQRRVGGGSINLCSRYDSGRGAIFVKHGGRLALEMFRAEAAGLTALADANAVRVPRVLAVGSSEAEAFIALEWIDFGTAGGRSEAKLGERLARQHRASWHQFGWQRDNTIGSTPQSNRPHADWAVFLRERRLMPQLQLAAANGADAGLIQRGQRLCELLGEFFREYQPSPALLHGDLWGGNWSADVMGEPVIFDPAVYYGDREADLAMTRLFGGFGVSFYSAYQAAWPLDAGAATRSTLYNLYHVLNHFNLFGGGYLRQARAMIDELLAEVG